MIEIFAYGEFFLITALIFSMMSLGLNLQWGQTGLVNVGVAGFVAIGAYTSAILTTPDDVARFGGFGLPILVGWVGAMAAAGSVAAFIGYTTLRLRDDYLAITTFGVATVVQLVALNAKDVTGGPFGIGFIPKPFSSHAENPAVFNSLNLVVVVAVVAVLYFTLEHLARSPWGRVLRALREDERAAVSLGKNVRFYRVQSFAVGGAIMGLAGAVQAHFIGFIAPENYGAPLTFLVWVMLIVGGTGSNKGAIVGSVAMWAVWAGSGGVASALLPTAQQARAASLQLAGIGIILCVILLIRPNGLLGDRPLKVRLRSRKAAIPDASEKEATS
ncbi:branched-chain amino acid ABC transporter permease [Ensifer sp. ENS05]|uniref:branched-chain amino acid ABC transporter permease n=1 Tax=Ensifer sp. ENS05 TaxID=2769277 RepID=UPI001781815F|nr:branched-chain amino acid ABC transporter permease [Ensifer sp. ENS05]MBD9597389.1 branched-chain amino acid ABC transporter permease [Ensifer sp. ENS05]